MNTKTMLKFKTLSLFVLIALGVTSCTQKKPGVRKATKTEAQIIRAAETQSSEQQAQIKQVNYKIVSIGYPELNESGVATLVSEIQTPQGEFLPITTTHEKNAFAYGVYNDDKNGNKIDIRAKCEGESCDKYTLLVTIVNGTTPLHQMVAISYNQDCKFNYDVRNPSVTPLISNIDLVDQSYPQVRPLNDCAEKSSNQSSF